MKWHNESYFNSIKNGEQALVLALWHNCSTIAGWALRNSAITVIVSDSKDGEYVARMAHRFGIKTIRGSTSSGAKNVIRQALKVLSENNGLAITPDGPRGPRYQVQSGLLWFAATKNAPIIPLHIESSRQWKLSSWDQHIFPKPFSTIHIGFGDPIYLEREELEHNLLQAKEMVEGKMMANLRRVQGAC